MNDLYNATELTTRIPCAPRVRISSAVIAMATGARHLTASLTVVSDDNGTTTQLSMPLDPYTMRAMARVLNEHATRIAVELLPLISGARPDPQARVPHGQEYA